MWPRFPTYCCMDSEEMTPTHRRWADVDSTQEVQRVQVVDKPRAFRDVPRTALAMGSEMRYVSPDSPKILALRSKGR